MFPPVDYPLNPARKAAADHSAEISYASLLDRYDAEQPITNDMILLACQKMDEAQQFPFAPLKDSGKGSGDDFVTSSKATVSNALLKRLKNIVS